MSAGKLLALITTAVMIALFIMLYVAPQLREAEYQQALRQQQLQRERAVNLAASGEGPASGSRIAFIEREPDGHYWTRADVQGTEVKFMIDTGASIVALTFRDAQRLGLKPEDMTYDSEIRTAGGITYGAPLTLRSIRVGRVQVENVDAVILRANLDQSLLGMSFLGELNSYEFRRGQLIIRQ
jgi:aspartyl protease family protein